jgi:DnaJ-class molecular chaperone
LRTIKKAFRREAAQQMPDKHMDDQEENAIKYWKFSTAYEILLNDDSKNTWKWYGNVEPTFA